MRQNKVLVVDDSQTLRKQVIRVLEELNISFVEAADGVEALERINSDSELSLILCDINMPLKSGMELLRETQTIRQERSLPMVMLTTEGKSQMVQEAKALGASGWLVKPFKKDQLILVAKKFLDIDAPQ